MEKFYFEIPSIKRKYEIIEYLDEFVKYSSDINGAGSLDIKMEDEEFAKSVNRCPGKTFLLIRENDNKIIGTVNLRWNLNEAMLKFGGHIGYGIRPTERRKGYNKINPFLAIIEAKKAGLNKVMLDCDVNNIASDKTLKALGGKLERTEIDPSDGILTNVYWFNVDETIEKYSDIYILYC